MEEVNYSCPQVCRPQISWNQKVDDVDFLHPVTLLPIRHPVFKDLPLKVIREFGPFKHQPLGLLWCPAINAALCFRTTQCQQFSFILCVGDQTPVWLNKTSVDVSLESLISINFIHRLIPTYILQPSGKHRGFGANRACNHISSNFTAYDSTINSV